MNNFNKYAILFSFISLWLTSFMSSYFESLLGFFLILSLGVLHGTNDLLILNKLNKTYKFGFLKKHLLIYNIIILLGVLFFWLFRQTTFLIFFIFSSYHFGEQHFSNIKKTKFVSNILNYIYGLLIFSLLFINHKSEVVNIVKDLLNYSLNDDIITNIFYVSLSMYGFILLLMYLYKYFTLEKLLLEIFHIAILSLIFKVSSLIWGFTVYFIFWHSIPSINEQVIFFYKSNSSKDWLKYLKDGFKIWSLSILFFGIFIYLLKDNNLFESLIFGFLTIISFPHIFTMICLFTKKNATPNNL